MKTNKLTKKALKNFVNNKNYHKVQGAILTRSDKHIFAKMRTSSSILTNEIEALKYLIEKMDIEMINAFLNDYRTYHSYKKNIFVSKLENIFTTFKKSGDTRLNAVKGSCNNCQVFKSGYTFIGNNSGSYLSLIFYSTDGKIDNLGECSRFKPSKIYLNTYKRLFINQDYAAFF